MSVQEGSCATSTVQTADDEHHGNTSRSSRSLRLLILADERKSQRGEDFPHSLPVPAHYLMNVAFWWYQSSLREIEQGGRRRPWLPAGAAQLKRAELYRIYKGNRNDPRRSRVFVIVSRQVLVDSRFSSVICALFTPRMMVCRLKYRSAWMRVSHIRAPSTATNW